MNLEQRAKEFSLKAHNLDSLVVDEGFTVKQLGLEFEFLAA
jgi:hypothetical protein